MLLLDLFHARGAGVFFFAALLFASFAVAAVEENFGLSGATYPVVVSGDQLGGLLGKEITQIRLFAYRQGVMEAIPLQIDQRDSNGHWVWSKIVWSEIVAQTAIHYNAEDDIELRRYLGRRYGHTNDDQDPDNKPVLDNNDVLVFMVRDMGEHVANAARLLADVTTTLELEITDPISGSKAWVYAAYYSSDPPPHSTVQYVHYEHDVRKIISPVYEITFSREHVGVMEQLAVNGTTLLDRSKFRGSLRLGGSRFGKTRTFDENDIVGYVYGYINGPVRVVRRTVARLHFGLLSSPTVSCDQLFYPYHSEIPLRLPANFLLHNASLLVASDYHNSPFRRVYTSDSSHPIPPLQDSSSERNVLKGTSNVPWVALAGDEVSIISSLTVPEGIEPFIHVTPWLLYDQRLVDPPETYLGTEPEAGYLIETRPGFPSGEHLLMGTHLYLPRSFQKRDAEQILELVNKKLDCRVTAPGDSSAFQGTP